MALNVPGVSDSTKVNVKPCNSYLFTLAWSHSSTSHLYQRDVSNHQWRIKDIAKAKAKGGQGGAKGVGLA